MQELLYSFGNVTETSRVLSTVGSRHVFYCSKEKNLMEIFMEGPSWKWREHNIAASLDCPPVHSALNCTSYSSDLPPLPHAPFLLSVTEASEDICKICFDRKIYTVIIECGHRVCHSMQHLCRRATIAKIVSFMKVSNSKVIAVQCNSVH